MFGLLGIVSLRDRPLPHEAETAFDGIFRRFEGHPACRVAAQRDQQLVLAVSSPAASDDSFIQRMPDGSVVGLSGRLACDLEQSGNPASFLLDCFRGDQDLDLLHLNGSFAAFCYDSLHGKCTLMTDRLASTPVLYHAGPDLLVFAPDLSSLAGCGLVRKKVDWRGLAGVLSSGNPHDNHTFMRDVRFLRGGEYLQIAGDGKADVGRYWDYHVEPEEDQGEEEYRTRLHQLILECVDRGLQRSANPALLLSGGFDSKVLLGACLELGKTVTVASYTHRDIRGTDFDCARRLAKATGMPFLPLRYERSEFVEGVETSTPFYSGMRPSINEYGAAEGLRGHTDLALFGDEAFGWKDGVIQSHSNALNLVHIYDLQDHAVLAEVLTPEAFARLEEADRAAKEELLSRTELAPSHDAKDYFYVTERVVRNLLPARVYMRQHGAVWFPWLDAAMLDFMRRLPTKYRVEKRLFRSTARQAFAHVFQHPNSTLSGQLSVLKSARATCLKHPEKVFLRKASPEYPVDRIFRPDAIAARAQAVTQWHAKRALYDRLASPQGPLSAFAHRCLAHALRRSASIAGRRPSLMLPNLLERVIRIRYHVGEVLGLDLD